MLLFIILSLPVFNTVSVSCGILYPRESETRQQFSLDGLWNFVLTPQQDLEMGFKRQWYKQKLNALQNLTVYQMPVPSSFNDITADPAVRDYVGTVWYEKSFFVPHTWTKDLRIWLRFSGVHYSAKVWVNGRYTIIHKIGHLPFAAEITDSVLFNMVNTITVAVSNVLQNSTIPQGILEKVQTDDGIKLENRYTFDFYNYAGIHRPVTIFTTPKTYIDDISVHTDFKLQENKFGKTATGIVKYQIKYSGNVTRGNLSAIIVIVNKIGKVVAEAGHLKANNSIFGGKLNILNATLWWPYLMSEHPGYLYTMQVQLLLKNNTNVKLLDVYRLPFGIRTVSWSNTSLFINNRKVYLRGFGRHEDSDIRGKGFDLPTIVRDYNLIKWIGANAYRTSHYPYAEEIMDLADQYGIMIIDECPAVNLQNFTNELLENHKQSLTELINRDKNRPSVIMWSIANEPRTEDARSDLYFQEIVKHVKTLDEYRPTTFSTFKTLEQDHGVFILGVTTAPAAGPLKFYSNTVGRAHYLMSVKHVDIVSINRYYGWYINEGHLDMIKEGLKKDLRGFHVKYNKPVLQSEYGAGTIAGMHYLPSYIWSEEYQDQLMAHHFEAFDELQSEGFFIGEFIWNFADFNTAQGYKRAGGNKKGIFTRNREPKAAAFLLRQRYWYLAKKFNNVELPKNLRTYVSDIYGQRHDEL